MHKSSRFDAISCLREAKNEVANAVLGGLPPVLTSVYAAAVVPEGVPVLEGHPGHAEARQRAPEDPAYQSVSLEIPTRSRRRLGRPGDGHLELRTCIQDAINSKGLVP